IGGDITVNGQGGVTLAGGGTSIAGPANSNYSRNAGAQIGHGGPSFGAGATVLAGYTPTVQISGSISVSDGSDLLMTGGSGSYAFAQIGQGGPSSFFGCGGFNAGAAGDITVNVGGNATLTGGYGQDDYVQIGHGGAKQGKKAGYYGGAPLTSFTNSGSIGVNLGTSGVPGPRPPPSTGGRRVAGAHSPSVLLVRPRRHQLFAQA